ncbi:hypothetical protein [Oceaniglobus roseus]|uniref:hypothetical protein n=1 Tax=Oceaniglobus roseus TaxID=1737570 RepID=UPI000C7E99D1|nr:hypothetical protein [Kandeliimicrobium roseum]
MTFKTLARAMAVSGFAVLGTAIAAQAATCNISMPASGNNQRVASVNAQIVAVLQSKYPSVQFEAPTSTRASSVEVPNCNGADFRPTGANVTGLPAGASEINPAVAGGAAAAALLAVVLIVGNNDDENTTTTTTTTGN